MKSPKLSKFHLAALRGLADKPKQTASAYDLKVSTGWRITVSTMQGLRDRGLVVASSQPGSLAFPADHSYILTDRGRKVLMDLKLSEQAKERANV